MIDRLAFGAVAVALASVLVLDGTFGANLHRAFGPNPMPDLAGWQVGVVCAPLAYVATARLTRPYLGLMAMTLAAHSMQISSSRRPVTGIPACTHGQGVLSLLYTGRDDAIAAFPNHFSISSSTRSV